MNVKIKKISSLFLTSMQVFVLSIVFILEYLSNRKMGVARYLTYKKALYETQFFNPDQLFFYKLILVSVLVISLAVLAYSLIKLKKSKVTGTILIGIVATIVLLLLVFLKDSIQLNAFPFFILALVIITLLQSFRLVLKLIDR